MAIPLSRHTPSTELSIGDHGLLHIFVLCACAKLGITSTQAASHQMHDVVLKLWDAAGHHRSFMANPDDFHQWLCHAIEQHFNLNQLQ